MFFALGSFQEHRELAKPAIVEEQTEWLQAEAAAADVGVAVDPAAERLLAVVQVNCLDAFQSDHPVDLFHRGLVKPLGRERITGRKNVTRVNTHAQAI